VLPPTPLLEPLLELLAPTPPLEPLLLVDPPSLLPPLLVDPPSLLPPLLPLLASGRPKLPSHRSLPSGMGMVRFPPVSVVPLQAVARATPRDIAASTRTFFIEYLLPSKLGPQLRLADRFSACRRRVSRRS
jgi:hypothetical protein